MLFLPQIIKQFGLSGCSNWVVGVFADYEFMDLHRNFQETNWSRGARALASNLTSSGAAQDLPFQGHKIVYQYLIDDIGRRCGCADTAAKFFIGGCVFALKELRRTKQRQTLDLRHGRCVGFDLRIGFRM
jgi:hypothetical protein